jgi:hypothetical protein
VVDSHAAVQQALAADSAIAWFSNKLSPPDWMLIARSS